MGFLKWLEEQTGNVGRTIGATADAFIPGDQSRWHKPAPPQPASTARPQQKPLYQQGLDNTRSFVNRATSATLPGVGVSVNEIAAQLPKATGEVVNNLVNPAAPLPTELRAGFLRVPETAARSIEQVGRDLGNAASGRAPVDPAQFQGKTSTNPVRNFLYGEDPIKTYQQQADDFKPLVQAGENSGYLPKGTSDYTPLLAPVLAGLDLAPGGGGKGKVAKEAVEIAAKGSITKPVLATAEEAAKIRALKKATDDSFFSNMVPPAPTTKLVTPSAPEPQLLLPPPKTAAEKASARSATQAQKATVKAQMTAEKVAAKGPVSPAMAKQIFKQSGVAPEVMQKHTTSLVPMVETTGGMVVRSPQKANVKALREQAHNLDVYGLGGKDKLALKLARETPDRIQEDVFGNEANKIKDFLINPVRENETKRLEFLNKTNTDLEGIYKQASLKRGSEEDKLAFRYGEGQISKEDVLQHPKGQQIIAAADHTRALYDQMLDQVNESLRHYGYKEIPKRKNYLTHTQQLGNFFQQLEGLLKGDSKLPTEMSGINMDTKPGKSWFKYAQKRKGAKTEESLIRSVEAYLPGASQQIYHTDSVQRARALENALSNPRLAITEQTAPGTRVRATDRDNVGELNSVRDGMANVTFQNRKTGASQTVDIPVEHVKLADNPAEGKDLSNYNSWLSEYTNTLAGKKISIDRPFEKIFGRAVLDAGAWLKRKTGANMIGGNISSALTNFIPLTQALAATSKPAMAKAFMEATRQPFAKVPGVIDGMQSQFVKNRFAKTDLVIGKLDNAREIASWLFKSADRFTAESVVRGKYYELRAKDMSKEEALKAADEHARRTLADRSIGEMPNVFNSQVLGAFTQFQLEVNNQVSVLLKDMPKNAKSKKQLAGQLSQVVLYSFVANEMYQAVTGRRPALDPIEYALNLKANLEKAGQEEEDKKGGAYLNAAVDLGKDFGKGLPFSSMILDGGRIPLLSGMPDAEKLMKDPWAEITKPVLAYGLPFGGNQLKKTWDGVEALTQGEETDSKGKQKFPINQDPVNAAKVALFGKWADPNAQAYLNDRGLGSPGTAPQVAEASGTSKPGSSQSLLTGDNTSDEYKQSQKEKREKNKADVESGARLGGTKELDSAQSRIDSATEKLSEGISNDSKETLLRYAKLNTKGKDKFNNDPKNTFSLHVAQYEQKKLNGEISELDDYKEREKLAKEKVSSDFPHEVVEFYGMSKARQKAFLAGRKDADKLYAQAQQLDAALLKTGFITDSKYKYGLESGKGKGKKKLNYSKTLGSTNASAMKNQSAIRDLVKSQKITRKRIKT